MFVGVTVRFALLMLGTGLLGQSYLLCYLNCEMTNGSSSKLVQSSIKIDCTGEIKTDKKVLVDVGIINRFSAYNVLGGD